MEKKNITWSELFLETGKIDTPNTLIHDRSLPWLCTGTSINSGWVKPVLCAQTSPLCEMMQTYKCFLHVSKLLNLIYS